MNNEDDEEEKLYRIKKKEGAHLSEKVKEDGSRSSLQFDDNNNLEGPVDLVEVKEDEYTKEIYVQADAQDRSLGEIILEDIVVPAVIPVLEDLCDRAIDAGLDALFNKAIPAVKEKGSALIGEAKQMHSRKKNSNKQQQALVDDKKESVEITCSIPKESTEQNIAYHTEDEIDQIISNMQFAALYIASGIRELSNTVITDSDDTTKKLETEKKLKELSTDEVMNTINFMLEDRNRDMLDQATIALFEAFRDENLIVNGKIVPIEQCFKISGNKG